MKACPRCGKAVPDDAKFCPSCGQARPADGWVGPKPTRAPAGKFRKILFYTVFTVLAVTAITSFVDGGGSSSGKSAEQSGGTPVIGNDFSKEHFCKEEATILTKNISQFSNSVNMEIFSPYKRFYHKARPVLERFYKHKYRGYSKTGEAWPSIEAEADGSILNYTLGVLKRSRKGSVNALLFYTILERTNLILSMDESYCGSPSWWPKQYPTSAEGMKKVFQKGG